VFDIVFTGEGSHGLHTCPTGIIQAGKSTDEKKAGENTSPYTNPYCMENFYNGANCVLRVVA
jgi:hypothetical protein